MGNFYSDFNKWNKLKKNLHRRNGQPKCKSREVWWCYIGKNIGVENGSDSSNFSRPILVMKSFGDMFWGLPITNSNIRTKQKSRFYYYINSTPKLRGCVAITHIKSFDNRRLIRKITKIDIITMKKIQYQFKSLL